MDEEITIVTMYYDIKEGIGIDYLKYFDFWAPMDNFLIVYTEEKYRNDIYEIREKYNREKKTKIIVINEFRNNEPFLYDELVNVSEKVGEDLWHYTQNSRFSPDYEYKEVMKYWCLQDAHKYCSSTMMAWLDFGYNHGGDRADSYYVSKDEFYFKWKTNLSKDKIHLFSFSDLSKLHTVSVLQMSAPAVMGGVSVMSPSNAVALYELIKKAEQTLCLMEIFDTDSRLLFLTYKMDPEKFEVHVANDWFMPFEMTVSNMKFTTNSPTNRRGSICEKITNSGKKVILTVLGRNHRQSFDKRISKLIKTNCYYSDK